MSEIRKMAQKLLEIECGYVPNPFNPYESPPNIDRLWPYKREEFERMAEKILFGDSL